jgi:hypothetical protein
MAPVADIAGEVRLPEGVSLREVPRPADLERIAGLGRKSEMAKEMADHRR